MQDAQRDPDDMFCSNCGKPIKRTARFCAACGHQISSNTPTASQATQATIAASPQADAPSAPPGYSDKNRIAAGVLGVLLGGIGCGSFYLGRVGRGIAQIAVTVFTCGLGGVWGFIEGIIMLADGEWKDGKGRLLKKHGQK